MQREAHTHKLETEIIFAGKFIILDSQKAFLEKPLNNLFELLQISLLYFIIFLLKLSPSKPLMNQKGSGTQMVKN
jgi:hypothetical protein